MKEVPPEIVPVDMELIGTIVPDNGATARREAWIALIASHPSLARSAPRQGFNPFTRAPTIYRAAPDAARVLSDDSEVGAIHWAADDSCSLVVWSLPTDINRVTDIARDIASTLGWRLVPGRSA